jgi:hypothetical protein
MVDTPASARIISCLRGSNGEEKVGKKVAGKEWGEEDSSWQS